MPSKSDAERASMRAYFASTREKHIADCREWRAANRDRVRAWKLAEHRSPEGLARRAVQNAVKYGHIKKSLVCELCNSQFPKNRIYGHHEDYSRKLDVVWVCLTCHAKIHREAVVIIPPAASGRET